MEGNRFAVRAITQCEDYGCRTRRRVERKQGFGVRPSLAADGVESSIRPESQTCNRLGKRSHIRAHAGRGIYRH